MKAKHGSFSERTVEVHVFKCIKNARLKFTSSTNLGFVANLLSFPTIICSDNL